MRIRFLSLTLLLFLTGCAPHHFIDRHSTSVTLYLEAPDAIEVFFVSSIDSFRPQPTQKNSGGTWVINNPANREFHYFYVVDGRVYVPDCQYREKDDFGTTNCIYQLD
jgi:hypothetical protein